MVTEYLGFLIIIGALLVFGVRWWSRRQPDEVQDIEEMRTSTDQLKAELERSADAVVSRMGSHIKHLEELIRQAEERNIRLETQLGEYRRVGEAMQQRSDVLQRQILEARQVIQELSLRQTMPVMSTPLPMMQSAPVAPPVMAPASQPVERVDAEDFAAVLQQSIARDEQSAQMPAAVDTMQPLVSAQQAAGLAEAMTHRPETVQPEPILQPTASAPADPVDATDAGDTEEPPNAAKARALLLSGYSIEETARETGIGRGAIELLQEMSRRELE